MPINFGNGVKPSFYFNIAKTNNKFTLIYADGFTLEYTYDEETETYINVYDRSFIKTKYNNSDDKICLYLENKERYVFNINGNNNISASWVCPSKIIDSYDNETQLYWVSSRYYSPELCRWISPDSIEYLDPESINGINLYCYCFNNPVNYVDPDGHMPFLCALLILGAIGMVANVASQALTDLAYGNEFKWENYLVAAGAGFLGGMCYAIPGVGSVVSAAATSGLTTAGQMAVSGKDYDGWDYLIMAGGSAVLSGLTAWDLVN